MLYCQTFHVTNVADGCSDHILPHDTFKMAIAGWAAWVKYDWYIEKDQYIPFFILPGEDWIASVTDVNVDCKIEYLILKYLRGVAPDLIVMLAIMSL